MKFLNGKILSRACFEGTGLQNGGVFENLLDSLATGKVVTSICTFVRLLAHLFVNSMFIKPSIQMIRRSTSLSNFPC